MLGGSKLRSGYDSLISEYGVGSQRCVNGSKHFCCEGLPPKYRCVGYGQAYHWFMAGQFLKNIFQVQDLREACRGWLV